MESHGNTWRVTGPNKFFEDPFASVNLPVPFFLVGDAFIGDGVESAFLSGQAWQSILLHFLADVKIE